RTQQLLERGFVENGDTELLGLGQLRARALAGDDIARLLRDAAGDLAAPRRDLRGRFVARAVFERAGEHERLAGERRVLRLDRRPRLAREVDAGVTKPREQVLIAVDGHPRADALRDRRSDTVDRRELLLARRDDRVEARERC